MQEGAIMILTHWTSRDLPEFIFGILWPALAFIGAFIVMPRLWTSKKQSGDRDQIFNVSK
jgi:hypothetical protein